MYMISYNYDIIQHVIWYHSPLYDIMYMISYWGHMISYVYDIMYMISYENTYDIIRHDILYHIYMISYLMYTISYLWYHVYGAMRSWISMYDIICIIEPNASKAKWTLQNTPLETQVESRYVHLNNFITWIFDVLQPIQRWPGNGRIDCCIDKFDL